MSEWLDAAAVWLSYRPRSFLMFAPRNYWRLFELHNEAWWPLHVATLALGAAAWVWLLRRARAGAAPGTSGARRAWLAAFGLACAFVAATFVFDLYGSINWAARGGAAVYFALALALLVLAVMRHMPAPVSATDPAQRFAWLLLVWSIAGQPLLAPLAGRPWQAAEVFGLAPDPTVMGSLALLIALAPPRNATRAVRWAWAAAWWLAWLALAGSAATLATMGEPQALAPALVCVLALALRMFALRPAPVPHMPA